MMPKMMLRPMGNSASTAARRGGVGSSVEVGVGVADYGRGLGWVRVEVLRGEGECGGED